MKYRKWDPKTKAKIVLEGLQNNLPLRKAGNSEKRQKDRHEFPPDKQRRGRVKDTN